MPQAFPHLFAPLQLRHKTLRNRIVFGAHTANMAEQGIPGARHLGYYLERARGGAAMIVVEPVPVHATAVLTRGNMLHSSDAIIEPLQRITDACHAEGAVMLQQLYHVGQHGDFDNSYSAHWSPSRPAVLPRRRRQPPDDWRRDRGDHRSPLSQPPCARSAPASTVSSCSAPTTA